MLSVINRIGNERLDTLTTADFLTINALYHDMPLDNHMQDRLKHLTEMGIVEHIGRSKCVLSRSLYSAVGKSGVHTRIVGLDREKNKELLLKHMREKGPEGAPLRELQQVLPGHNRSQIHMYCLGNYAMRIELISMVIQALQNGLLVHLQQRTAEACCPTCN